MTTRVAEGLAVERFELSAPPEEQAALFGESRAKVLAADLVTAELPRTSNR